MNIQRKRIKSDRISLSVTESAAVVNNIVFTDAPAVNIHGVHIDIAMTPFGPDETLVGRWYVACLPQSIANDPGLLADWVTSLNTITDANGQLKSSEFIWGSGQFICAEQAPFNHHFAPKTSRNMQKDSGIFVIVVADAVSGVVDNWDAAAHMTLFISS